MTNQQKTQPKKKQTGEKPSRSLLSNIRLFLLYSFPATLYFSYYPLLRLPFSSDSTNYELSLPLIWLFLFSVLSLKDFYIFIKETSKKSLVPLLPLLLPIYFSLTIFWSKNPIRAILTVGIFWCLYISIYSIVIFFTEEKHFKKDLFLRILLFSAAIVCVFCWIQCLLDIFNVPREISLLCRGCTSHIFGFPHPSGFAIEPQFMGSLLIAPTLFSNYLLINKRPFAKPLKKKTLLVISILFMSTLFLTFSRGAIYSFLVAVVFSFVINLIRKNKNVFKLIPLVFCSFLISIAAQGIFAHFSYTNDTFLSGVEKSISQLSLGLVEPKLSEKLESKQNEPSSNEPSEDPGENLSVFSGYVEESTNIRLDLNRDAIAIASESPRTITFGYGLGSAGTALYEHGKTAAKKEIIQNQYFSLLVETGAIGLLLTILSCSVLLPVIKKYFAPTERTLIYSIILAFALSLNFFSGLPNALHIYLFPIFIALTLPMVKTNRR